MLIIYVFFLMALNSIENLLTLYQFHLIFFGHDKEYDMLASKLFRARIDKLINILVGGAFKIFGSVE